MSILVFGKNGQLSRALQRSLTARKTDYSCYGRNEIDLVSHPENSAKLISEIKPSAVINGCAFTDVNGAERQGAEANILNAKAPGIMAAACRAAKIPFIHISTDYVFDGQKSGSYQPNDKRNPLNAYGRSKAAGERAVIAAGGQSLILRTSWVYDGTSKNFLTTMLRLAKERTHLDIVNDQFGRPTYAGQLAESCLAALEHMPSSPKIYHVSNSGPIISWADFAAAIFEHAKIQPEINRVSSKQFSSPTQRPANSALNISSFEKDFRHPLEPWDVGLKLAFHEMGI